MKNICTNFNKFLNIVLKILFALIAISSTLYFKIYNPELSLVSNFFIILSLILIGLTYYCLKKDYNKTIIVIVILFVALVLRLLWFYSIDSIPISDFNRMFICAGELLNGSTNAFKGTSYIARFPHMTMTVLYFALIRGTFSNPLFAIRFINVIFSMVNVVLLFFIAKEVFRDKNKSVWVCLIAALYPPMISYNNVYCSENLAIPLLLLSVLLFLKALKNNNRKKLLFLSGIILGFTQLFRPIGYLMVVAYIMYICIYFKDKLKDKLINNLLIIVAFVIPLVSVSYTLMKLNITENPLWHGTEPPSVSMLKGANIEAGGRWNEEDASLFDEYDRDYDKVDTAAKSIIKKRLTEAGPQKLIKFYTLKYTRQWLAGDFAGTCWAECGLDEAYNRNDYLALMGKSEGKMLIRFSTQGEFYMQLFLTILILMSFIGLFKNKKNRNLKLDLFYIMFCGISLQCLITESQDRYTYPFSWLFIILAMTAFNENTINDLGGKNE